MSEISLTLARVADDRLRVRCEREGHTVAAEAAVPPGDRLGDLLQQTKGGHPPPAAFRALGRELGAMLFAGDPGALARDAFRDDPETVVLLQAEESLAVWPWELAHDAELDRAPVADGAAMLRVGGPPVPAPHPATRGVLVVPESLGRAWLTALQAATRHVARKAGIDIVAVDPATGPNLRRTLARGAALMHLQAPLVDGRAVLDDGVVALEQVGVGPDTWLVVLGGGDPAPELGQRLRTRGVPIVLARQIALRPNESAALDRELYRALAGGASLADAVRRARNALQRNNDGFSWAAPILWTAPTARETAPAQRPPWPCGCSPSLRAP